MNEFWHGFLWGIASCVAVSTVASNATIAGFDGYIARVRLDANKRRHGRVIEGLHSYKDVSYTAIVGEPEGRAE